jgi:hypothetical protein
VSGARLMDGRASKQVALNEAAERLTVVPELATRYPNATTLWMSFWWFSCYSEDIVAKPFSE